MMELKTMNTRKFRSIALAAAGAALAFTSLGSPAMAQRDPAYAAARADGKVGEKTDGYLGVVSGGDAQLRRMVDDINIKRRAVYAKKAQAASATLEAYGISAGCQAISRTVSGEMYQTPSGSWEKRGGGAPRLDSRCR